MGGSQSDVDVDDDVNDGDKERGGRKESFVVLTFLSATASYVPWFII